jgi:large subunit ribosomal protein L19
MDIASLVEKKDKTNIPALMPGDSVKISAKVVEGDKERIQMFQGVIIKIRKNGASSDFTVRRVSYGVGVERTFPYQSPFVEKVEVLRHGKVRRAKLYHLRGLSAKKARLKELRFVNQPTKPGEEQPQPEQAATEE